MTNSRKSDPNRWKPFIANRIRLIQQLTGDTDWRYVPSKDNPADIVSRGTDLSIEGNSALWFQGPQWLLENVLNPAPNTPELSTDTPPDLDVESQSAAATPSLCMAAGTVRSAAAKPILFEHSFSSWTKAIRFWAYISRLTERAKQAKRRSDLREAKLTDPSIVVPPVEQDRRELDASEMISARLGLIRLIQKTYFPEEFESACSNLKKNSPLYQLHPTMDKNGMIRCVTRLVNSSELTEDQKFPIILPANCNFSKLIIREIHEKKCFHSGGIATVLHHLREEFFILRARHLTRQVLSACALCKIFHATPASLPTALLPSFRIERSPPFFFTGCDFAGPIWYRKESGEKSKSYILLFTCSVTRGIHIELTTHLSTFEVLQALQKFTCRYPAVNTIISDNGLAFKGASRELQSIYDHITHDDTKRWLANSKISWKFITPSAPHMGAFYERQIQTIKRPLRKVLGTSVLPFRDLEVIIASIVAIVNRRPLTTATSDPNEISALSPSDLMYGYQGNAHIPSTQDKPSTSADVNKIIFSRRWLYQQRILNSFWKRYHDEYLAYLRSAHLRMPLDSRPLKQGDICPLKDTPVNRAFWPLCRVVGFPEGVASDRARSCIIRTGKGQLLTRPIKNLYPLESAVVPH